MIKKINKMLIIIVFSILFILFLPNFVKAYTWTDETTGITWNYNINGTDAKFVYVASYTSIPQTLEIPEKMNNQYTVKTIGYSQYYNIFKTNSNVAGLTKIVIPDTVEETYYRAFYNLTSLKEIKLSQNMKILRTETFSGCTGLSSVEIPDSVQTIEQKVFSGCSGLTTLKIPVTTECYKYNSTSSSYTQNASFYRCTSIKKVILTKGTTGIMPDYNPTTTVYNPWYNSSYSLIEVVVEDGVKSIGSYSFGYSYYSGCSNLKKITLPNGFESFGSFCFCKAINLEICNFPTTIKYIGNHAFYSCSKLSANFDVLQNIEIDGYAFENCENLTERLEFVGNCKLQMFAFSGCKKINEIVLSEEMEILGTSVFASTSVSEITIPQNMTVLPSGMFSSCSELTTVNNLSNVTEIGDSCFYKCKLLKNIELHEGLVSIGNSAFFECEELDEITLPTTLQTIGNKAFYNCTNVFIQLDLRNNITSVGEQAFANCTNLSTKLILGEKITSLYWNSFENDKFNEIEIYCSKIPSNIFHNMNTLEKLVLGDGVTSIGKRSFYNCNNLKGDLTIPDSVVELDSWAFGGCTELDGVITIGSGITDIKSFTFSGCNNVKKIILPKNIKKVFSGALTGIPDIYYQGEEEDLTLYPFYSLSNPFVHYLNCTHDLDIDCPDGYEIINKDTNEVLESTKIACGSQINIGIRTNNQKQNLKLYVEKQAKLKKDELIVQEYELDRFQELFIEDFNRNYKLYISDKQQISPEMPKQDIAIRTFIDEINFERLQQDRTPVVEIQDGQINYKHSKNPVTVGKGDLVKLNVRVYNEGYLNGNVNKISLFLPEGLELSNDNSNNVYGWKVEEKGKITTNYLENQILYAFDGTKVRFKEIPVICKVVGFKYKGDETRLVTITEVSESDNEDNDSIFGQILNSVDSNFKLEEANQSTEESYIQCDDDDTDFENIVLKSQMPIEYSITLMQFSEEKELLKGATYILKDSDEKEVGRAITDENGKLTIGPITTYGGGTDTYYMEQVGTPEQYVSISDERLEINVTKIIINEEENSYSIFVDCSNIDCKVSVDTFIPIYNDEQLFKIGSNETITINEIDYVFSADANYRLMNDIDLEQVPRLPINAVISGIIDGNGYSIKNLKMNGNYGSGYYSYGEIGLFRVLNGCIYDLNLENVDILAYGGGSAITGKYCIGALAGFMESGEIKNCTVSGKINSQMYNTGGFIGHTRENKFIKLENCKNYAQITAISYLNNLGGLIGCSLGSIKVINCSNEGKINGSGVNIGGLIGFSSATDADEKEFVADYNETNKEIFISEQNKKKGSGEYNIILENRDLKTLGFLEGAIYTVYDSKLEPIENMKNIQLENGKLNIATVDIEHTGTDTYYIKEEKSSDGYSKLDFYVKLIVNRYWDSQHQKYRVEVNTENIANNYIDNEEKIENTNNKIDSETGIISTIPVARYSEQIKNAIFINCYNNANISGLGGISGILGTSYSNVRMTECRNYGELTSNYTYQQAGGLIALAKKVDFTPLVIIDNCLNEGNITANGSKSAAGGIIAESFADIRVYNSLNIGNVSNTTCSGGILGDSCGHIDVKNCVNKGIIKSSVQQSSYVTDVITGGIIGRNMIYNNISPNETSMSIDNCINIGDIESIHHCGGILGYSNSKLVQIRNCLNEKNNIVSHDGDIGGMIGYSYNQDILIDNCKTLNCNLIEDRIDSDTGTYGSIAGILGNATLNYGVSYSQKNIFIKNCDVLDTKIYGKGKDSAGIFSCGYNINNIGIDNCNVERCDIQNVNKVNNTYTSAGGIISAMYSVNKIEIENCNVNDSDISSRFNNIDGGEDTNVGAILGFANLKNIKVNNCNVNNCSLFNESSNDNTTCTGGAIGCVREVSETFIMSNINVKNSIVISNAGDTGGIIGLINGGASFIFNNDDVIDSNISSIYKSDHDANVAGICASAEAPNNIIMESCNVYGTEKGKMNISGRGNNIAGLVGWSPCYNKLKNCNVRNVDISGETDKLNEYCMDTISGLIGEQSSNLDVIDCNVENLDIIGDYPIMTGGVAILGREQ